jgi:hypothetical protein
MYFDERKGEQYSYYAPLFFKNNFFNSRYCTLVPIRAMTGLGAKGEIRPKIFFQNVSKFGPLYLSQKWWRSWKEAKHMYL